MSDDRSNSVTEVDALLAEVKALVARAEERRRDFERREREDYLAIRAKLLAAKKAGPAKLTSNRKIADAIGKSPNWVDQVLKEDWVATDGGTPFSGARDRGQEARRVLTDPEAFYAEGLRDPKAFRRFILEGSKRLAALKPKEAADLLPPPEKQLFIFLRDHIVMGPHILFVGTSDNSFYKSYLLEHLGALGKVPEGDVNWNKVETDAVVVTDPPYGQSEPGVPGDDNADHSGVYSLLRPRGGFSFCAYRPPRFFEAEEGIRKAGGTPIHYLAMMTKSAHGQGPDGRVHNVLQAIIYWERRGERPWIKGRSVVSVLEADEQARAEMKEMREHHTTPKPVNVMEDLIDLVTEPGDFVLDPFTGSGSTLIACERTGRRFIGFEANGMNDPNEKKWHPYAEVAVQRWQNETGQKAVVHRSYANPPTMLFDDLKANGGWVDGPTDSTIGMTG